jgi:hypothetical protein
VATYQSNTRATFRRLVRSDFVLLVPHFTSRSLRDHTIYLSYISFSTEREQTNLHSHLPPCLQQSVRRFCPSRRQIPPKFVRLALRAMCARCPAIRPRFQTRSQGRRTAYKQGATSIMAVVWRLHICFIGPDSFRHFLISSLRSFPDRTQNLSKVTFNRSVGGQPPVAA